MRREDEKVHWLDWSLGNMDPGMESRERLGSVLYYLGGSAEGKLLPALGRVAPCDLHSVYLPKKNCLESREIVLLSPFHFTSQEMGELCPRATTRGFYKYLVGLRCTYRSSSEVPKRNLGRNLGLH